MLMTTSYYFIAFDPRRDLFQSRKKGTTAGSQLWETNSVDKYIFNLMTPLRVWLARILGIGSSPQHRKKLEDIFIAVSYNPGCRWPPYANTLEIC